LGSLTAHLLEPGDHGRLGFHPRCPTCRKERLFGSLSSEPLVSRRVQAALATGVLALSVAAPGTVAAAGPDRQREGAASPEHLRGDIDAPDFDPGGDTALPFEVAPSPTSPGVGGGSQDSGDGPPVESEPVVDPDARLLAPTTPATQAPPTEADAPVPPAEVAPTVPPAEVAPAVPPAEVAPAVPPAEVAPGSPAPPAGEMVTIEDPRGNAETSNPRNAPDAAPGSEPQPKQDESDRRRRHASETSAQAEAPRAPAIDVPQSAAPAAPLPGAAGAETVPVVEASAPSEASQPPLPETARWHIVEPGESLWSIATRLLGPDASPGRIAREVDRLWELNRDRIGTGDPDVLMVGARLRLR
jgi:LysM domain